MIIVGIIIGVIIVIISCTCIITISEEEATKFILKAEKDFKLYVMTEHSY
jgi:hypothetical protein